MFYFKMKLYLLILIYIISGFLAGMPRLATRTNLPELLCRNVILYLNSSNPPPLISYRSLRMPDACTYLSRRSEADTADLHCSRREDLAGESAARVNWDPERTTVMASAEAKTQNRIFAIIKVFLQLRVHHSKVKRSLQLRRARSGFSTRPLRRLAFRPHPQLG